MTTPPPPGDPQGRDPLPDDAFGEETAPLTAPTPPPGVLDAAHAAAMAAFDDHHAAAGDDVGAPLGDLAAAHSRRWYQRVPLGAVAAAIAAIALVGTLTTLTQIDTDGDDDLATAVADDAAELDTAGESGDDSAGVESIEAALEAFGSDAAEADGGTQSDARTEEGAAALGGAASYEDLDAFLAVVAGQDPPTPAGSAPPPSTTAQSGGDDGTGGGESAPCDAVATAGVDGVVAVEVAFVDDLGVLVAAVVYESGSGSRVAAVDLASCVVLDDRAL